MKRTAIAPSNIAFIKYWGKKDEGSRVPANPSISMNLSAAQTVTTVDFSKNYPADDVQLVGETLTSNEVKRIITHIDRIRQRIGLTLFAKIVTKNSFPKSTGIASSASGFAALTVAACAAAGLMLPQKELTILARLGSGSAARSIPDGFVLWQTGETSERSFAYSLFPHTYWGLRDILCIVKTTQKETPSAEGMKFATTSPYWPERQKEIPSRIDRVKKALEEKNIQLLGETIEEECLSMHKVMNTQKPSVTYWNDQTQEVMDAVVSWRRSGLPVYFTIDAGPNVHCICEVKNEGEVVDRVKTIPGVQSVLVNAPSEGTRLVDKHLF